MEHILSSRIDTEVPRACQIAALKLAGAGLSIPEDLQDAVLSQAERGKDILKKLMVTVNEASTKGRNSEYTLRESFLRLAAQIAFSHGVNTPEACQLRLDYLHDAIYKDESSEGGVGFTE